MTWQKETVILEGMRFIRQMKYLASLDEEDEDAYLKEADTNAGAYEIAADWALLVRPDRASGQQRATEPSRRQAWREFGLQLYRKIGFCNSRADPDQVLQFQERFRSIFAITYNRILIFQSRSRPIFANNRYAIYQVQYRMTCKSVAVVAQVFQRGSSVSLRAY